MCEQVFFRCNHCGNMLGLIENAGVPLVCCGDEMEELIANTSDGAKEKHLPEVKVDGDTINVKVGSVPHPMGSDHHIAFVYLQTANGGQRKCLKIDGSTNASFKVIDDTPIAVFSYCNLHGLWKTNI